GASLAFALLLAGFWQPLALFGPIMAVGLGNGFAVPNAQAGAVSVEPLLAGTASGIAGCSQMFFAAVVSQVVGMLQDGTPYPMAAFMTGCAVLSLLGFVLPRRLAERTAAWPVVTRPRVSATGTCPPRRGSARSADRTRPRARRRLPAARPARSGPGGAAGALRSKCPCAHRGSRPARARLRRSG